MGRSQGVSSASQSVLEYLEFAERNEPNLHLQCDIRIAWITVIRAALGEPTPHVSATLTVLGLHPSKVWSAIEARRKAMLGPLYEEFFGESLPPKKPCVSERATAPKAFKAAA